jgi:hypothetical protein
VAPVPYVPALHSGADGAASRPASAAPPSVLDHLETLRATRGVQYRYAWWWWVRRPLFTSSVGALVLIGGVLPTVLSVLAYGTLVPPPREKRPSLRGVKRGAAARPTPVGPGVMNDAGEEAELPVRAPPVAAAPSPGPIPKPLARGDETPVVAAPGDEKHFGAGKEDFYPTELHDEAARD